MKKHLNSSHIALFLTVWALFSACNALEPTFAQEEPACRPKLPTVPTPIWPLLHKDFEHYNGPEYSMRPDTADQIAEYVRRIYQDRKGYLWFGTSIGVCRYDGKEFVYYSIKDGLPANQVTGITEDGNGNIWFATIGGLAKYDGRTMTAYTEADGLLNNNVWSIHADKAGNIWAGTLTGICRYDGSVFTRFYLSSPSEVCDQSGGVTPPRAIWSIVEDHDGNLWFATNGGGIYRYDPLASLSTGGKVMLNLSTKEGLKDSVVQDMLVDKKGTIWFATRHKGIGCYDGNTVTNFDTMDGHSFNEGWDIYEDRSGNIWFTDKGNGVYRHTPSASGTPQGKPFVNFNKKDGLNQLAVQSIFQDREGRFWFGTGGGMYRFDGERFFNFTKKEGC